MLSVEGDCCVLIPQSADTYLKLSTSEEKGKWKVFVMHLFLFINQQRKAEELPPTNNTHLYVFMEILPKSKCLVVSVCIGQILRFGRWGLQTSLQGSLREVLHLYINEPQTGGAHGCSGFHIHTVIMFHLAPVHLMQNWAELWEVCAWLQSKAILLRWYILDECEMSCLCWLFQKEL